MRGSHTWRWNVFAVLLCATGCGRDLRQPARQVDAVPTVGDREAAAQDQTEAPSVAPPAAAIGDIVELTPELARRLRADHADRLELPALGFLSPEVAGILARPDSRLFELRRQVMGMGMGGSRDDDDIPLLALGGLRTVSSEAAAELAAFPGELRLDGLSAVDADLARVLAKFVGPRLSLGGMAAVSAEAAAALAGYPGDLVLAGLRELPPDIAAAFTTRPAPKMFGSPRPVIRLGGLASLSVASAEKLATADRDVHLAGLHALTPELARALVGGSSGMYLDGVTDMDTDVAEIIAAAPAFVRLGGLRKLSHPALARKLLRHYTTYGNSSLWDARSLTSISPEVADLFAHHAGDVSLDGLEEIDERVATALGSHVGGRLMEHGPLAGTLSLDGLERVDEPVARALVRGHLEPPPADPADRWYWTLSLDGVRELGPDAARALAASRGGLSLGGIRQLPPGVAAILAGHPGPELRLDGLTSLSVEDAHLIAKHGGRVSLDGLVDLAPDVADALATHEHGLELDGLTTLSPECAATLSRLRGGLSLEGIRALDPRAEAALARLPPEIGRLGLRSLTVIEDPNLAKLLARQGGQGHVRMHALETMSPQAAAELAAAAPSSLTLDSVRQLDAHVAEALAAQQGVLWLAARALSPEAAAAIARHEGVELHLDHIRAVDAAVAAALAGHRGGMLSLAGAVEMTGAAAAALAAHRGKLVIDAAVAADPAVAEALAGHAGPVAISGPLPRLTSPAFARKLAEAADEDLWLERLETLTPAVAAALAGHEGELWVDGRLLADPAVADAVALHAGPVHVEPLSRLSSPALAKRLAATADEQWWLTDLIELSPAAAAALAGHEGTLVVSGAVVAEAPVADALAGHVGPVELDGSPTRLGSPALARKLAESAEHGIDLSGVVEITPAVAAALASTKGRLDLPALVGLDEAVAVELAKHEGDLSLGGVTAVDAATAAALARHRGGLAMPSLTTLDSPELAVKLVAEPPEAVARLSVEAAEALAALGEDHDVSLPGLKSLPADVAAALGKVRGFLYLDGLEQLDRGVAESLVGTPRLLLSLNGIRRIDEPVATVLARHEGDLHLDGLEDASAEALHALRNNPGIRLKSQPRP